uniref:Ig-like domain-containing protein n=1 Tax=Ciona savignyi TaxID=51511 RepID=H2YKY6_CIOSA
MFVQLTFIWSILLFTQEIYASAGVDISAASLSSPVVLNCSNSGDASTDYQWVHNNQTIASANLIQYSITSNTATGDYVCMKRNVTVNNFLAINLLKPIIPHKGHSITFTTGDQNKEVMCTSLSYPQPDFAWSLTAPGSQEVNLSNDPNYKITMDGQGNSVLTIISVTSSNKGNFKCTVNNTAGSVSTEIKVRIHSNLAPLWPSLAILFEVVTVGIIMYFVNIKAKEKLKELGKSSSEAESTNSSNS